MTTFECMPRFVSVLAIVLVAAGVVLSRVMKAAAAKGTAAAREVKRREEVSGLRSLEENSLSVEVLSRGQGYVVEAV